MSHHKSQQKHRIIEYLQAQKTDGVLSELYELQKGISITANCVRQEAEILGESSFIGYACKLRNRQIVVVVVQKTSQKNMHPHPSRPQKA